MSQYHTNDNGFRWLHLSDFHTGKDDLAQALFFKRILEEVQARVASGREPHAIFITGDIANRGQEKEYEKFHEEFLDPLTGVLQGEARSRIFFIPGNHDVDRIQDEAGHRYGVLDKYPRFLDPGDEGLRLRKHLLERFQSFADYDILSKKVHGTHWLLSAQGYYIDRFEINHHTIGILCLNTAWFCESDQDRLWLSPGEMILVKGLEAIEDCQTRIILGHHPIDWFRSIEQPKTRSLFGHNHVIYLHGHLHENILTQEVGAGKLFVTIQAGASWQAREDKHEVNSFLWCELDYDRHSIRVEPRTWSRDTHEFSHYAPSFPEEWRAKNDQNQKLDSFDLPLPLKVEPMQDLPQASKFAPPPGWELITAEYLESQQQGFSDERLLQFFDGRLPDWNDALLSPDVLAQREIVGKLESAVKEARQGGTIKVILLLGAAGEGKSTALRQVICNLVLSRTGWHVWWATEVDKNLHLPVGAFSFPQSQDALLVVADDASFIAKDICQAANFLRGHRKNIVFLLDSQKLAWREAEANTKPPWGKDVLVPVEFPAIKPEEAAAIVQTWTKCGEQGLGTLKQLPPEQAAEFFYQQTQSTGNTQGHSFFGAMLAARYGDDLQKHIRDVLDRLQKRKKPSGKVLLEALAVICAVHCINDARGSNLLKLSKDILAEYLGCKREEASRYILLLGDEAVANTSGGVIYSRHQEIAKVIVRLLPEFSLEFDEVCRKLVHAICDLFAKQPALVPDIQQWDKLPAWFFEHGIYWFPKDDNKQLGIQLAHAFSEAEPWNPVYYVDLSRFYRAEKQPEMSVQVLREASNRVRVDRKYYYEWATAEGLTGNYAMDACLSGISVADQADEKSVDDERAIYSLNGLASAFANLFDETRDPIFIKGCASAVQLGFAHIDRVHIKVRSDSLEEGKRKCEQEGIPWKNRPPALAFEALEEGILTAYEQNEDALPKSIKGKELTFHKLANRLGIYYS